MRAALLQLSSSDDPLANLATVRGMMDEAAAMGAELICTPEITNCVTSNRAHQAAIAAAIDQLFASLRHITAQLLGHLEVLFRHRILCATKDADRFLVFQIFVHVPISVLLFLSFKYFAVF